MTSKNQRGYDQGYQGCWVSMMLMVMKMMVMMTVMVVGSYDRHDDVQCKLPCEIYLLELSTDWRVRI